MFKYIPFKAYHVLPLTQEPMNAHVAHWYDSGHAETLARETTAYTCFVGDDLIGCFGIMELWRNRGYMWSVLSQNIKKHPVASYRGLKKLLCQQPFNRIEMDVPVDFELAHRRAHWLGFNLECARARKYLPSGLDASIYAWVRE